MGLVVASTFSQGTPYQPGGTFAKEGAAGRTGFMDPRPIGSGVWVIPEGYIPTGSTGPEPAMSSHETFCALNSGAADARLEITIYFSDRDPAGPYRVTVPAERTRHVRFNDLDEPEPVPKDTDYSSVIVSDHPVVVQHTRLDSRQPANALLSTIAFPVPDSD